MAYFPSQESIIIDPQTKVSGKTTLFGAQTFAEISRLCGGTFDGNTVSDRFWTTAPTGSGTATVAGGIITFATGPMSNSGILVTSVRTARYLTGNANFYIAGVRLGSLGDANNIKRWGAMDANNGFFFEQNAGTIRIVSRKNGVDTAFTAFNGKTLIHDTNFHTYEIQYGASKVYFFQDGALIHTLLSSLTLPVATLHLKIGFEVRNINASVINHTLECRSVSVNRHGKDNGRPQYYNIANIAETRTLKNAPGTLHHIVFGVKGTNTGTLTLYDSLTASGSTLLTIDTVNAYSGIRFDLDFFNGLTYVSSANVGNICIIYD